MATFHELAFFDVRVFKILEKISIPIMRIRKGMKILERVHKI